MDKRGYYLCIIGMFQIRRKGYCKQITNKHILKLVIFVHNLINMHEIGDQTASWLATVSCLNVLIGRLKFDD